MTHFGGKGIQSAFLGSNGTFQCSIQPLIEDIQGLTAFMQETVWVTQSTRQTGEI